MHEHARLCTPFPEIGKNVGDLIFIWEVEDHFDSSQSANAAVKFACADKRCAVPVSARIIESVKPGRKISPSSSFRVSDRNQHHVCDRLPPPDAPFALSSEGERHAHSHRSNIPQRWVDPTVKAVNKVPAGTFATLGVDGKAGTRRLGFQRTGNGQSVSQSQKVQSFAKSWLPMSIQERKHKELFATWNVGGTYFTAFHLLWFDNLITLDDMKIFVGSVDQTTAYNTGIAVDLKEYSRTGCRIRIWIPSQIGEELNDATAGFSLNYGAKIFALGVFSTPIERGGLRTLSLELKHADMVWVQHER